MGKATTTPHLSFIPPSSISPGRRHDCLVSWTHNASFDGRCQREALLHSWMNTHLLSTPCTSGIAWGLCDSGARRASPRLLETAGPHFHSLPTAHIAAALPHPDRHKVVPVTG